MTRVGIHWYALFTCLFIYYTHLYYLCILMHSPWFRVPIFPYPYSIYLRIYFHSYLQTTLSCYHHIWLRVSPAYTFFILCYLLAKKYWLSVWWTILLWSLDTAGTRVEQGYAMYWIKPIRNTILEGLLFIQIKLWLCSTRSLCYWLVSSCS